MGNQVEAFYNSMHEVALPTLRWTEADKRSLWNMPISQWGDYFSLRKAKFKMMRFYAKKQVVRNLPKLVPLYIKAVQKGHFMSMDYLQAYGDLILSRFVQNHFQRRYGLNSKQWGEFLKKEEELWQTVVKLRKERQEEFLKQKIMELDKIPKKIRERIVKKNRPKLLKKCLESYYHYQDGEDREGRKLPAGIKPEPTSLVLLQTSKETKKEKKPLPPIRSYNDTGR